MSIFRQGFDSIAIKDVHQPERHSQSHSLPIYATSTFVYENAEKAMAVFRGEEESFIYSRWQNPTVLAVEQKLAALESYGMEDEAKCILFGSGMGAISALFRAILKPGDAVIAQPNIYGATVELLNQLQEQLSIKVLWQPMDDLEGMEQQLEKDTGIKLIYLETPSNPTCNCYDLKAIAELAKRYNVSTAVDNTFASPYLQRPLALGIEHVVYSTTKYLNGHSNALGGAVISLNKEFMQKDIYSQKKLHGAVLSPFDAWLLNNGLKTLSLRMDRHQSNSLAIAEWLEKHAEVARVYYPGLESHPSHVLAAQQMNGFGGVLAFELRSGFEAGVKLLNNIRFCTLTASLGTPDTLIQHPASMSHAKVPKAQREANGITDGLIRLSVGIENVDDIIADLEQAIN